MKLVYIFDPREEWDAIFPWRVPTVLARLITRLARTLDYAESERGEWKDHYPSLDELPIWLPVCCTSGACAA